MSVDEVIRPSTHVDLDAFALLGKAERDRVFLDQERELRRMSVQRAAMVQIVDTSGSYADDAHHSVKSWVQAVANLSSESAAELVRTAKLFAEVPTLAEAASAGRVGLDQVREMARLVVRPKLRSQLAEHGGCLVRPAAQLEYDDFLDALTRWRLHADPDGAHRDHEASRERRYARVGIVGHEGVIHAEGDAAAVDEMSDILRAHAESEFLKDCEERRLRHGVEAAKHRLRRTHGQRMFDGLLEIHRKAARTGVPGVADPTVNFITTEADFAEAARNYFGRARAVDSAASAGTWIPDEAQPAMPSADNDPDPDHEQPMDDCDGDPDDRQPANDRPESEQPPSPKARSSGSWRFEHQRYCETENGAPVDPADMVVAALLGRVRSVIVSEDGRFLHAGSRTRLFTGTTREMILMLGRHTCNRHGCDRAGPCIQVDHVESYSCGGCTTALNGGPMCPLHNREKFDLGFTVTHDEFGWHHFRPDGTEIAPRGT